MRDHGFYRVKVEALEFELTPKGAQGLLDEVRWLEWKGGSGEPPAQ
jgi:hypothetical protein